METVSKLGLVLVAGGFSLLAAGRAIALGWGLILGGALVGFGPDLVSRIESYLQRRRGLAEGVAGWDASIGRQEGVGRILLRLTPPSHEETDPTVSCEVRLPDGTLTTPSQHVVQPEVLSVEGTWNPYYFISFPDGFHGVGTPLAAGEYLVTWSRSRDFGRQTLRRFVFSIDRDGAFATRTLNR